MRRPAAEPRALCPQCLRPVAVCVCAHLPDLAPATRVVILQHPKERSMPIGTARMAARCLRGATLVVGTQVEAHPAVARALADPARPGVLLWPGPGAADLATAPPSAPVTLFVVDGTWSLARKLIRLNPAIGRLPRYALPSQGPSEYRIRREPRAECLSTIEAVARALGVLEGDTAAYEAMLAPFRAMVDRQLAYIARGGAPRDRSRLLRRAPPPWAPPAALSDPSRVVVVAAEANAWPSDAKVRWPDELVHALAVRGDGSERFECVVRPSNPLAPSVPRHTGLPAEAIREGAARETFRAAFAAFLREGDAFATWGAYATGLLEGEGLAAGRPVANLRRVAADWLRSSPRSIEAFVADLALAPAALGQGRGGRRLGQMLAVYQQVMQPRPPRPRPVRPAPRGE